MLKISMIQPTWLRSLHGATLTELISMTTRNGNRRSRTSVRGLIRELQKGQAIEVLWVDSCTYSGWRERVAIDTSVRTVGMYIETKEEHIVVCVAMHQDEFCGAICIPICSITRLKCL